MWITSLFDDFISLIYPKICLGCNNPLLKHEECICTICQFHIPKTNHFKEKKNDLQKLFWGKVQLNHAAALYEFVKDSPLQKMIHALKYEENQEVGIYLGKQIAYEIEDSTLLKGIDYIIPVPLHPKKEKLRGYNQSMSIAKGIQEILKTEIEITTLQRTVDTESQTKKNKYSRWENVGNVFEIRDLEKLKHKHILLIDDVVTTGSTLESCVTTLQQIEGIKVSIVTIAIA
ncbi:MAG: ComF family protein [Flavobacteriales bacterium]|jgi:ComF family protein|nr:ComF family protein [Flavobacteriales bacterium]MBT6816089.1 ComF family protein [Flavobacteriales bacterium]MBT7726768.1 ComF family protein [Flavobacteriales bacterium]